MKKLILFGILCGFFFAVPHVRAADEDKDNLFNMIVAPPIEWVKVTAEYPFQIGGSFLGLEGDPNNNADYSGDARHYGYYESMSPDMYKYIRWGVN